MTTTSALVVAHVLQQTISNDCKWSQPRASTTIDGVTYSYPASGKHKFKALSDVNGGVWMSFYVDYRWSWGRFRFKPWYTLQVGASTLANPETFSGDVGVLKDLHEAIKHQIDHREAQRRKQTYQLLGIPGGAL